MASAISDGSALRPTRVNASTRSRTLGSSKWPASIGVKTGPGCNRVHRDARLRQRACGPACQLDDRAFAGRVGRGARKAAATFSGDARNGADASPRAHALRGLANAEVGSDDVDLVHAAPRRDLDLHEGRHVGNPGGGGETVDSSAERFCGVVEQSDDGRFVGDVDGAGLSPDRLCDLLRTRFVAIGHEHGIAVAREKLAGRFADTARAAGDHGAARCFAHRSRAGSAKARARAARKRAAGAPSIKR